MCLTRTAFGCLGLLLASVVACSGGNKAASSGGGTATGSVGGQSLAVEGAISVHDVGGAPEVDSWDVTLAGEPLTCGPNGGMSMTGPIQFLSLRVINALWGGSAPLVAPGTYVIPTGLTGPTAGSDGVVRYAVAGYVSGSSACGSSTDQATGGTVTITTLSSTHVVGSYDLTFPDGSLKGSFDAPGCDASLFDLDAGPDCGP
jgi:hypothetical protein